VGSLIDGDDAFVPRGVGEAAPAAGEDGALTAAIESSKDEIGAAPGLAVGHAAEADIDGRRAGRQEGGERRAWCPAAAIVQKPITGDLGVARQIVWRRHHRWAHGAQSAIGGTPLQDGRT